VSGHHRQAETLCGSGRSLRLARGPTEHTKCGEIRFVDKSLAQSRDSGKCRVAASHFQPPQGSGPRPSQEREDLMLSSQEIAEGKELDVISRYISNIDVATHPELHHYTSFSGLSGILQSNTIWATHFSALNDTTEVTLLRDPLIQVVANRLLTYAIIRQGTDYSFAKFVTEHGGPQRVALDAHRLIKSLYEQIFASTLVNPFIASFCSHANDQLYEKKTAFLASGADMATNFVLFLTPRRS